MHAGLHLALADTAVIERNGDRRVTVRVAGIRPIHLDAVSAGVADALDRLKSGATDRELTDLVVDRDGDDALAEWYVHVGVLERRGVLSYAVRHAGAVFARLQVMTPYFRSGPGEVIPSARYELSRFACMTRGSEHAILESPLSCARVELHDSAAAGLVGALCRPLAAWSLAESAPHLPAETVAQFVALLDLAGMVTTVDGDGRAAEDRDPLLRTWSFPDLLYHSRSRAGRHDAPQDTFRFLGAIDPEPAVKPPMSGRTIALMVPGIAALMEEDVPFTRVLEERRSLRAYADDPLTLDDVGAFLYRAARVKRIIEPDGRRILYQSSVRPYPGGGACYELELYLAAHKVNGLERGLYRYDPLHHRLEVIEGGVDHVDALVRDCLIPPDAGERQLLIVVAARFQRMMWKYQTVSYSAILKNVGVLYQTMYLVATAMGLAPCALGGGNAELFARATGLPWHQETSVGEFMLGRPASRAPERVML